MLECGVLVATTGVLENVPQWDIDRALRRHFSHDWGEVCTDDWKLNDEALEFNQRILSAYTARNGVKFWIITEWNRSATTVLLPGEY